MNYSEGRIETFFSLLSCHSPCPVPPACLASRPYVPTTLKTVPCSFLWHQESGECLPYSRLHTSVHTQIQNSISELWWEGSEEKGRWQNQQPKHKLISSPCKVWNPKQRLRSMLWLEEALLMGPNDAWGHQDYFSLAGWSQHGLGSSSDSGACKTCTPDPEPFPQACILLFR